MLKSLFESSIDKLHIPADMKTAIKQINNICLEAEDNSTDPNERYKHDFLPSADQKAQPAGNDEPNVKKGSARLRKEILPKLLKEYGNDDPIIDKLKDVIKLINNPKTLKDGSAKLRTEVFAQIMKDQGNDAPILNDIKDIIKIINTPDPKKEEPKKEEPKAEEPKAEEAKAEEPAENEETKQAQNDEGATEANTASEAQPAQTEETNTAEAQPAQTEETKAAEEQPAQNEEAQPAQNTEGNATEPKAEDAKAEAQPAQTEETNTAEAQPAQTEETKTAEEQPAQNAEPQENKGVQIAKGSTREPSQVRTSGPASSEPNNGAANAEETQQAQNNEGSTEAAPAAEEQPAQAAEAPKPKLRFRADVMTVQFYLQSLMPNSNIVADGLLGPKTISAIQQKEDIDVTGKMDNQTQNAFNLLLTEAKKKVIPMQEQLGVKADGLIGKQTLQAAKNANMNVTNAFSQNVKPTQQVASKKADVNVLDTPFDAAKADKELANKQITQVEYNIWKSYGVSPEHQRSNPNEVRAQVSRLAKLSPSERRQQSQDVNVANSAQNTNQSNQNKQNTQKQLTGAEKFKPQNDEEKKFYDQTVQNYIKVYKYMGSSDEEAAKQADRVAKNHLVKFRNGTLPKAQMPKEMKPAVGVGNDKNVAEVAASVTGPKDDAEKRFFNQTKANWTKVYAEKFKNAPDRVEPAAEQQARIELMKYRARMAQAARKNGQQQQQPAQQQVAGSGNAQPAQQGGQKKAAGNDYYSKTTKNGVTTEQYGGSGVAQNADEEQFLEKRRKHYQETKYKNKREDIAYEWADHDARNDLVKYRLKKQGKMGA